MKFNPSHRYLQAGQICLWSQAVTRLISGEWVTCCLYRTVASSGWWRGGESSYYSITVSMPVLH